MSKDDDTFDHYKSIPLIERSAGDFSEHSINAHHQILKSDFFKRIKRKMFTSSVNYIISYALVLLMIYGFCRNHNYPFSEAYLVTWFLFVFWCLTFVTFTIVRFAEYPTRKNAREDLELIRAVEDHKSRPDFIA